MRGLCIGRAELVNRFLSKERQRLIRSLETFSFEKEMRHQKDLLVGGLFNGSQAAAFAATATALASKRSPEGSPQISKTGLGGQTTEKAKLEIADPLVVQDILAAFSATAETRKKAADRIGGGGALSAQELIVMLESIEHHDVSEDAAQEEIPAEDFLKLLHALRWGDDKHKPFANAENLAKHPAYDRLSFLETLKGLLREAEAQRDALADTHSFHPSSSSGDTGGPQDSFVTASVADAVPEDFMSPRFAEPFSLWQSAVETSKFRQATSQKGNTAGGEANETSRKPFLPDEKSEQSQKTGTPLPPSAQAKTPEVANGITVSLGHYISEEAVQAFVPRQELNFPAFGLEAPPERFMRYSFPSPEDSLVFPEENASVFRNLVHPSDFQALESIGRETIPSIPHSSTPLALDGSEGVTAASLDAAGEVQEIAHNFSQSRDAEMAEGLFEERTILIHDVGGGSGSSADGSSSFGERPPHDDHGFFQPSQHGVVKASVFSELAKAPSPPSTTDANSPTALSFLNADWPEELGRKLSHWAHSGKNFMTLELQPERLGKLFLRVETDGTSVSAVVQAEYPEAREILQRNMTSLRDVLAEHGLQLTRFSVDVRHDNPSLAERDLAPWAHADQRAPSTPSNSGASENTVQFVHVYDAGLGRSLSVRV